jgi:hypothetical protein
VSATPAAAAAGAATHAVSLPLTVSTASGGGTNGRATVSVTVTYVDPVDVAIIGALLGPIIHTSTVTMAVEPP